MWPTIFPIFLFPVYSYITILGQITWINKYRLHHDLAICEFCLSASGINGGTLGEVNTESLLEFGEVRSLLVILFVLSASAGFWTSFDFVESLLFTAGDNSGLFIDASSPGFDCELFFSSCSTTDVYERRQIFSKKMREDTVRDIVIVFMRNQIDAYLGFRLSCLLLEIFQNFIHDRAFAFSSLLL